MAVGEKQKLITEIVSTVLSEEAQTNKTFSWFINKHTLENFGKFFMVIDKIFISLNGSLQANQTKRHKLLNCDAYFGGSYNFIFEFDELQHFSSMRLNTFNHYLGGIKLNFDLHDWKNYCILHKTEADKYRIGKTPVDFPFQGGRTAQRAYLDCFRDLLPEIQGLNPTLRISEFEVMGITENNKDARSRIEKLLNKKIA